MGMYLDVLMVYGVTWKEAPSAAYPEDEHGEQIDVGVPVGPDDALVWGYYGYACADCERYLAVFEPRMKEVNRFGVLVQAQQYADRTAEWDRMIREYCASLGLGLEHDPGWLALATYG